MTGPDDGDFPGLAAKRGREEVHRHGQREEPAEERIGRAARGLPRERHRDMFPAAARGFVERLEVAAARVSNPAASTMSGTSVLRATVMMAAVATDTPAHPMNTSGTIAVLIVPRSQVFLRAEYRLGK